VPAVYMHGLLGSPNDAQAVLVEKQTRSINRTTIDRDRLFHALEDSQTLTYQITHRFVKMLKIRTHEPCFHPNADQQVLDVSPNFFTVWRSAPQKNCHLLSIINVTARRHMFELPLDALPVSTSRWRDVLSGKIYSFDEVMQLRVPPYRVLWLKALL